VLAAREADAAAPPRSGPAWPSSRRTRARRRALSARSRPGSPRRSTGSCASTANTDRRPINTYEFASNWELSTARAISVVKVLVARGIPVRRLAATGFGEFQPIDAGEDEIAFRRNRRIELKLTQR